MAVGLALIFAQAGTTDQTARQINALILALLVVAALLGVLTFWYWRYTDPRKRTRQPIPIEIPESREALPDVIRPEPEILAETYATDDGISVDEWLSLTGPQSPKS